MSRRPNDTGARVRFQRQAKSQTECARVLAAIDNSVTATIKEIAVAIGLPDSTVSARIGDLRKAGVVEETPVRRKCRVNGYVKKTFGRAPTTGQLSLPIRRTA